MDARSALEAMEAIRATVPAHELANLDAEYVARRNVVAPEAGITAVGSSVETIEPTPTPLELDPATAERLAQLPEALHELTLARYEQRARFTDKYLKAGNLPEGYELPSLTEFVDRIESLVPTFEHMSAKGMTPSVEFIPLGLDDSYWSSMFSQHEATSNGTYRTFEARNLTDPTDRSAMKKGIKWDVAVVDASERPTVTGISKDGKNGSNRKYALETLRALPTVDASANNESVIAQGTVTEAEYRALQLSRVERGERPVDAQTWTLVRENANVDRSVRAVWADFNPYNRQVRSRWSFVGNRYDSDGPRVGASGTETLALSTAS
jgi:hypothetical protein